MRRLIWLIIFLENLALANANTKIKMLIWWDYLPKEVLNQLAKNKLDAEITTYRSNEIALGRLSHNYENFDVVVISSLVVSVFQDQLTRDDFSNISKKRHYESMFGKIPSQCLPYAWGASLFAYNSRFIDTPPVSIQDMIKLKKKGFTLGVIDDLFELSTRIKEDHNALNPSSKGRSFTEIPAIIGLVKEDFLSSLPELSEKKKIATYGWHGSTAALMAQVPDMKYSLPKGRLVLGYDAVCVVTKDKLKEAKKFVEILTSKKNVEKVVKATQYFSPYHNHTEGLKNETLKIRSDIQKKIDAQEYLFLRAPDKEEHLELNTWWRTLRYGT